MAELGRLDEILAGNVDEPRVGRVSVVVGTAGVGKTALALRWAHRVVEQFPDGQLYVNLRGYDPGPPVTPDQVLDHFLRTLEVPPSTIPVDVDSRAALFRSLLADRRMLVILDNAATVGQVRPLLPGTAKCLVVVTSRSRLQGLMVRDGAHRVPVDTLTEPEAIVLLRGVLARYRAGDDLADLTELARLCARLPLALRIAAERAASRPWMPLAELITDLRDASGLWDALSSDDEETDAVRSVFAWSYRALPAEAARAFRLLGLYPGLEFGIHAAAALLGCTPTAARHALDVLEGAHLLERGGHGRYQFHDLLRVYANDQALEEDPRVRTVALHRVLTWYLHTADAMQAVLSPSEPRVELVPVDEAMTPLSFVDQTAAYLWYEAERGNLVAAVRTASEAGLADVAWQLPLVLRSVYMNLNPFDDWFETAQLGLRAAQRAGNLAGEAEHLESLAMACTQSQRLREGIAYYERALARRRELGDDFGEALTLNGMGLLHLRDHALRAALECFELSLARIQPDSMPFWAAVVRGNLGAACFELDRVEEATEHLTESLSAFQAQGERRSEGNVWHTLSMVQREMEAPEVALTSINRALSIAQGLNHVAGEAYWLLELSRVQRALDKPEEALLACQRAAVLHRQVGDRSREACAMHETGCAYRDLGRVDEAADFLLHAVGVHRELGDQWQLVLALEHLAGVLAPGEAERYRREALVILSGFDDPKAVRLRARIGETLG